MGAQMGILPIGRVDVVASLTQRPEFRNFLKALLVIMSGAFMILPAYLNTAIFFKRLNFQIVTSMSISLMLFSIGIVTFILVMGKDAFEKKKEAE
jgi:hypothetical protein